MTYDSLSNKYQGFSFPQAEIELNRTAFGVKNSHVVINEIHVENTCGFEASVGRFRIYNVYNAETGKFDYEALKKSLFLGAAMTIRLGYVDAMTTVFVGFVSSVDFCFEPDDMPYIEVVGMDVKGIMMASNYAKQLTAKSFGAAVREILNKTAYSNLKAGGGVTAVEVSDTPDSNAGENKAATIEMVSESDYEFVVKAAKKFNFEFFVDSGKVYFRKAKSDTASLMELGVGTGIVSFRIGYSLTGIVETVEARAMDPGTGKIITKKEKFSNNLSTSGKAKGLVGGSQKIYIDPSINSQQQADARVAYLMETMSYRLGTLDCECIGLPELAPGKFITVAGLGAPADNQFYLTTVTHSYRSETGYRTRILGKAAEVKT
ncbi:hypothetical protein SDC9_79289 [bioreactor metagenome]|uniref:Uncharacterized protein n=1 Tax=bioreactor metagenome TaxID=1076179 RepID=A0A644Z3M6_9ZZZZ